jgi:hypothetical protein
VCGVLDALAGEYETSRKEGTPENSDEERCDEDDLDAGGAPVAGASGAPALRSSRSTLRHAHAAYRAGGG